MKQALMGIAVPACVLLGFLLVQGRPPTHSTEDDKHPAVDDIGTDDAAPTARAGELDEAESLMAEAIGVIRSSNPATHPETSSLSAPSEIDAEWQLLPRGVAGFLRACSFGSPDIKAQSLFRCKELNPRDVYIPKDARQQFECFMEAIAPSLRASLKSRMAIYSNDFHRALANGSVPKLAARPERQVIERSDGDSIEVDTMKVSQLEEEGADLAWIKNGVVYGASRANFPASRDAMVQGRFIGLELASCIVAWFQAAGTLEDREIKAIMAFFHR